jgi:hypothetical protein
MSVRPRWTVKMIRTVPRKWGKRGWERCQEKGTDECTSPSRHCSSNKYEVEDGHLTQSVGVGGIQCHGEKIGRRQKRYTRI